MRLQLLLLLAPHVQCFWAPRSSHVVEHHISAPSLQHDVASSHRPQNLSRISQAAGRAANDIIALEGEPVCHTVAARFLANNCRILEGKDDATMLTDSGRHIRDFLESYAVSLAICDLERGNKTIPDACTKFRETTLAQIPVQPTAHLHVTSDEIQGCLSTFAGSAVIWGTYISHKQNALRFCEAAMSENSRGQCYQRGLFPSADTDGIQLRVFVYFVV